MSTASVPPDARASERNWKAARAADRDELAALVEREVKRVREARPHLSTRLDRAAALLVAQLSLPPHTRPVRVRIGSDGLMRGIRI